VIEIFQKISYIISYVLSNNIHEIKLYKSNLSNNEITIIDVGSNHGFYYKKIINNLKPNKANIYSIEPNKKLLQKQKLNKYNLIKFPIAISDTNKKQYFFERKSSSHSSLIDVNYLDKFKNDEYIKYTVECKTLLEFFNEQNIKHVDILKIDIEGFEEKIIEDIYHILKFCNINFIKIEILFRNDKNEFDDSSWVKILNSLSRCKFNLIGMSNIKYEKNNLFFFDAIFQNKLFRD
jgi:FkbM family methyltransferase